MIISSYRRKVRTLHLYLTFNMEVQGFWARASAGYSDQKFFLPPSIELAIFLWRISLWQSFGRTCGYKDRYNLLLPIRHLRAVSNVLLLPYRTQLIDFSTAVARRLNPSRTDHCRTPGSSTTWFRMLCYCCAELNSVLNHKYIILPF